MVAVAKKRVAAPDPTIYPDRDDVGEGELQRLICELLRPLLARFLAARGETWHVGADTFIYWKQHDSSKRVAPDVYAMRGIPQSQVVPCWKVWETGVVPSFALEVVSRDVGKDYESAPELHAKVGTGELVIFDPEARARRGRARWQVYRQVGKRGLVSVAVTNDDRVRSKALGYWLVATGQGTEQRVRIATGASGDHLVPTEAELVEVERAAKEVERAAKEGALAAQAAAEAEVARLRAELAKRRR
jgi:hypothetical protein